MATSETSGITGPKSLSLEDPLNPSQILLALDVPQKGKCKKLCKHTIHGHAPLLHLSEQHIKPFHSAFLYIVDVE